MFVERDANGKITGRFTMPQYAGQEEVPDEYFATEDALSNAIALINAWKAKEMNSGFAWSGHQWDSDETARTNIMAVALAGLASPLGYWTDADNQDVPVDATGMQSMYAAMLQKGAEIHARQRAMKEELASYSLEQLANFVPSW